MLFGIKVVPFMAHRNLAPSAIAALFLALRVSCAPAQQPPGATAATDPAHGQPSVTEIQREVDTGREQAALDAIQKLQSSGNTSAVLDRLRGLALYNTGQMSAAEHAFAAAIAADPNDMEAKELRGLALVRLGRSADAIPLLEAAASHSGPAFKHKADPNYALALCYMDTRRFDDARHAFAAQFGVPQDSAAAYLVTARMLLRREVLPAARQFVLKALELDPNLPMGHELAGEIALAQGQLQEAIAQFETERKANPLDAASYDRLGDAYAREGDYAEAQRVLQQAVLLEPYSTGPFILLGKTLLKMGDTPGAAMYLQHAAQMDPANYMTHFLLSQAYRSMGRPEDAQRETELSEKYQHANQPHFEQVQ